LRTPLTSIKGNIELMEDTGVPANLEPLAHALAASTARLGNLIEDLLAITTVESGKLTESALEPKPIKPLLESVAETYTDTARQKHLEFVTSLGIASVVVSMNEHLLKIALDNILANAFKFTQQGRVELAASLGPNSVVIKVSDSGIGIAAQELPKLFTKFHRGTSVMQYDYEGTGIGLYLTKLIVDLHKGEISVDSKEGQGTTVTIELPALLQ
jgi:signal transduction histidine kinase